MGLTKTVNLHILHVGDGVLINSFTRWDKYKLTDSFSRVRSTLNKPRTRGVHEVSYVGTKGGCIFLSDTDPSTGKEARVLFLVSTCTCQSDYLQFTY